MPTLQANKTIACATCGKQFSYTVRYFQGQEVFTPIQCDPCDLAERAVLERVAAESARQQREIVYRKLGLPYTDSNTVTVQSKLPASRAHKVIAWRYSPKAPFCWGESGLAKTRSVIELLRRLWVEEEIQFNFVRWVEFQNQLDGMSKFGGGGHAKVITPLLKTPMLVLDDVLKGRPNESVVTALFHVIDGRMGAGLPTAITTKYQLGSTPDSPFEVRLGIGNRDAATDICRRLRECCANAPFVADLAST